MIILWLEMSRKDGKQICETIYEYIDIVNSGYAVVENNNKQGVIDLTGRIIVDCLYHNVKPSDFNEHGYMRVRRNYKWTLVNRKGEEILPCIYDQIDFGADGMIEVVYNQKVGYVILD